MLLVVRHRVVRESDLQAVRCQPIPDRELEIGKYLFFHLGVELPGDGFILLAGIARFRHIAVDFVFLLTADVVVTDV